MFSIVQNNYNLSLISVLFAKNSKFFPGSIALIDINGTVSSVDASTFGTIMSQNVFGIFGNIYDPPHGDTTINGSADVLEFSDLVIVETDCFDITQTYSVNESLYYNSSGQFTNQKYSNYILQIGKVLSNNSGVLVIQLNTPHFNKAPVTNLPLISNVAAGVATKFIHSSFAGQVLTYQPFGWITGPSIPTDMDKKSTEPIFDGMDFPNGSKGSVCKNCGNCNEYILVRDYVCYNCK